MVGRWIGPYAVGGAGGGGGGVRLRLGWVETGCAGFLAIPYASRRLPDPNAVFSEKVETIPHLTRLGHREVQAVVVCATRAMQS